MSDNPDGYFGYEDLPPEDNPFFGLDGFDEFTENDPYERIEQEVLNSLGIEDFDEIILDISDAEVENIRGNRFQNLQEAITYLFDAGVLRFSGVVIAGDEIAVEIKPRSP